MQFNKSANVVRFSYGLHSIIEKFYLPVTKQKTKYRVEKRYKYLKNSLASLFWVIGGSKKYRKFNHENCSDLALKPGTTNFGSLDYSALLVWFYKSFFLYGFIVIEYLLR